MNIKDIISKYKEKKNPTPVDWSALILDIAKQVIAEQLAALEDELRAEMQKEILDSINKLVPNLVAQKFKGEPGEQGPPGYGVDGVDGQDADEKKIITAVLKKFPDEAKITRTVLKKVLSQISLPQDGQPGAKGKDGSPDTPRDIARKLNAQEGSLNMKVISGLPTFLENLKNSIRSKTPANGGGGGMGTWKHEQFALTSATTSVTLASRVAASGTAIMVRYQGQFLAHGVQYTSPGNTKVIALLFTPDDSTTLDVTYVRT